MRRCVMHQAYNVNAIGGEDLAPAIGGSTRIVGAAAAKRAVATAAVALYAYIYVHQVIRAPGSSTAAGCLARATAAADADEQRRRKKIDLGVPLPLPLPFFQGAGKKKKSGTPVVGGWVRVRKRTNVRFFFDFVFNRVFELSSSRNAQKRDKKNREKVGFGFLVEFFVKTFRHDFFAKRFL
jgi:hypothetical protein